jgi:dihydroceramide fatty acyl 2-hydroxylase
MARTLKTNDTMVDEYGIDLKRPLFPQLVSLGDDYDAWVHRSYSPKTLRELAGFQTGPYAGSLTIFTQPWLERQTHMSWRLILSIWLPVALAALAASWLWRGTAPAVVAGLALSGIVLWTLVEYALHRMVFHSIPRSPAGQKFHFLAHGIHHLDPNDPSRLVFPPLAAAGLGLILYASLELLLPTGTALALFGGLILGYLAYDLSHYLSHHHKTDLAWLHFLKRYHLAHHHRDHDARFGVSSPFWDLVFRTGSLAVGERRTGDQPVGGAR